MGSLMITAILKPKPGLEEQVLTELKKVQIPSRQESGCIKYDLRQSVEDHTFVLNEEWENDQAFEKHILTDHYQEYRKNTSELLSSKEVYKLRAIERLI